MMSKSNKPFHHDSYSSLPYLSLQSVDLPVGQAPPTARWDLSVPIYTLTIFKIYLHSGKLSTWLRRTPLVRTRDRGFGGKPPSGCPLHSRKFWGTYVLQNACLYWRHISASTSHTMTHIRAFNNDKRSDAHKCLRIFNNPYHDAHTRLDALMCLQ